MNYLTWAKSYHRDIRVIPKPLKGGLISILFVGFVLERDLNCVEYIIFN